MTTRVKALTEICNSIILANQNSIRPKLTRMKGGVEVVSIDKSSPFGDTTYFFIKRGMQSEFREMYTQYGIKLIDDEFVV